MANRVAVSTLNASTIDILNVIRQNASYDYQQNVPVITQSTDIPRVGEVIYGTPSFANQFLNALVNRIALVAVRSATFNNPYARLKKGYLEYGETIEEIFVNIAKVVEFSTEKASAREFKRTIPDAKSAFHVMNWRVMYPVTIQDEDLKRAFLSLNGVQELIAKIVDSVYTAAEYDEFLLFKYLLIKAISHGKFANIVSSGTDLHVDAVNFRGVSNTLTFMKSEFNESHVKTSTPKSKQIIFMDSMYNARFDVDVLASAFNMDKADFIGSLYLIDEWNSFDNERFDVIRENSDGLEEVTSDELAEMSNIKAVIVDEDWFQVYDNMNKFTEKYVASGLYWNYFYHTWKTFSHSPFSNAVAFVSAEKTVDTFTVEIMDKSIDEKAITFALESHIDGANYANQNVRFVQTDVATTNGIAIQPYGAVMIPSDKATQEIVLYAYINDVQYMATSSISSANNVGATVTMNKVQM